MTIVFYSFKVTLIIIYANGIFKRSLRHKKLKFIRVQIKLTYINTRERAIYATKDSVAFTHKIRNLL